MMFYAGQGYAVAISDYDNRLTENGISHYFIGEVQGRAMLDIVRALKNLKDSRFRRSPAGDQIFMAGYSQGGHSILWADRIRGQYAADVKIKGLVGFAPATDLMKMFTDTAFGTATSWIPPYTIAAFDDYYNLTDPATIYFQGTYGTDLGSAARTVCIDQAGGIQPGHWGTYAQIGTIYQPDFLASLRDRTFVSKHPQLADLLKKNLAGDTPTETPLLIIAGNRDIVIKPDAQTELMRRFCKSPGANAQVDIMPNVTHYTAMSSGRTRMLDWMKQIKEGGKPDSQCGGYR
jgi:pimeloyl-ACP methyl ester carboxylesterase